MRKQVKKLCSGTQALFIDTCEQMVDILFAIVNTAEFSASNLCTVWWREWGGGRVSSDDEFYTDAMWRRWCK